MRSDHLKTAYIILNTRQCTACGKCAAECPEGVLGMIRFFFHKHAIIKNPDSCSGCRKCVKICPKKAIIRYPVSHIGKQAENVG